VSSVDFVNKEGEVLKGKGFTGGFKSYFESKLFIKVFVRILFRRVVPRL